MKIHTLDLNFCDTPHTIAAYLVVGPRGPVLIDTGPASLLETMLRQIADHGYAPADIRHVFVTHIHLDHAGGAGWWAQQGSQIYVHPNGAKHLIDPSKLLASAERVYGQMMDALWGQMLPAPQERVTVVEDSEEIQAEGLKIFALDTPGHAYHHHTFRIGHSAFTGDASGVRMPNSSLITLPAPPPEFNLEAWHKTLSRLLHEGFAAIFPTHFGAVNNVREHLEEFTSHLSQAAEFVGDRMKSKVRRGKVVKEFIDWNRDRALALELSEEEFHKFETANPFSMSVDGMMRYWRKKWEAEISN